MAPPTVVELFFLSANRVFDCHRYFHGKDDGVIPGRVFMELVFDNDLRLVPGLKLNDKATALLNKAGDVVSAAEGLDEAQFPSVPIFEKRVDPVLKCSEPASEPAV